MRSLPRRPYVYYVRFVPAEETIDIMNIDSRYRQITMNYIPGIGRQCLVILVF